MSWRLHLAELVRPIRSWAPRGADFLYKKILGNFHGYKADAELKANLKMQHRVFYDRFIQANVYVDITDWACRAHYYKGVYYDRTVPLLTEHLLNNGGTFIDVGANRGLHTLHAARVLGAKGIVYAFEPHPITFDILKAHLTINAINNCIPYNMGISNKQGSLELNMFADQHSGTCSFINTGEIHESVSVSVQKLDDVLNINSLSGPILVKIDVEGFEYNVLQGMERLLERSDVSVVCEITDEWLTKAGSSANMLFEFLTKRGFSAYLPTIGHTNFIKEKLELTLLNDLPSTRQFDALFSRKQG
jgi:FkbM family methyltransferase